MAGSEVGRTTKQPPEGFFRALFMESPDGVYRSDVDGRILEANPAMARLLGHPLEALLGMNAHRLYVDPEDRARFRQAVEQGGAVKGFEVRLRRADGTELDCVLTSTVRRNAEGEILGYQGIIHDITDRKRMASVLRSTLEATTDAILVLDLDETIRYHNRRFREMWEIPGEVMARGDRREIFDRALGLLGDPDAYRRMARQMWEHPERERRDVLHFRDGRIVHRYVRPRRSDGEVRGWVLSFRDVTAQERLQEELERMAYHDPLTGLANRRLLREQAETVLAGAKRSGRRVGLVFLDLARFKKVNDTLGHTAGDEVLKEVGRRLSSCLRGADVISRTGGDEFALLLGRVEREEDAREAVRRVRSCLESPFHVDGHALHLDTRMGMALYPDHAGDFDRLFLHADQALHRLKREAASGVALYDPGLDGEAGDELTREAELRRALEDRSLSLHLQPVQDARSGRTVGAEALVRWEHPGLGLLPAAHFVPLAEETGLVSRLDRQVLERAIGELRSWTTTEGADHRPWISVNLSAASLSDPSLPVWVEERLTAAGVPPEALVVEVTETMALRDPTPVSRTLGELRELGIRVAIDDFGTGHAVLGYLKRFHADILKMDMLFVHRLEEDDRDRRLLEGIVALGHRLGMTVVAEGVETERQMEGVRSADCDLVQGYLVGRPGPPERVLGRPA